MKISTRRKKALILSSIFAAAAGWGGVFYKMNNPPPPAVEDRNCTAAAMDEAVGTPDITFAEAWDIVEENPGPYRREFRAIQEKMDDYMDARVHPFYNRVVVVDPERIDALTAFGFSPYDAVKGYMIKAGYPGISKEYTEAITEGIYTDGRPPLDKMVGIAPLAVNIPADHVCIVVPTAAYTLYQKEDVLIEGLDIPGHIDFFNEHEAEHCRDGVYRHNDPPQEEVEITRDNVGEMVRDQEVMQTISVVYRKETLADVGAVGRLIREKGWTEAQLKAVMEKRIKRAEYGDFKHLSAPALSALAQEVRRDGIEAFRALPADEAEKIYVDASGRWGLNSADAVRGHLRLRFGNEQDQSMLGQQAKTNRQLNSGMNLITGYGLEVVKPPPPFHTSQVIWRAAQNMDNDETRAELKDLARQQGGGDITPVSLLAAYNTMQAGLRAHIMERPNNFATPVAAMQLRYVFLTVMRDADAVAEAQNDNCAKGPGKATFTANAQCPKPCP